MSALVFVPPVYTFTRITTRLKPKPKHKVKTSLSLTTTPVIQAGFSDPFVLQLAETLEDSLSPSPSLQKLRDSCSESLLSTPWPSRRDEPFRFTDTSLIKQSQIHPISKPPPIDHLTDISKDAQLPNIVIVDGFILNSMSNSLNFPDGVFVGSMLNDPEDKIAKLVSKYFDDFQWGDLFWSINGLGAPDVAVIYVPAGVRVENPIHLRYVSVEGGEEGSNKLPVSNPRVLVVVEEGGEVGIIEEFVSIGSGDKCYWANSVLEVMIEEGAKVKHSYIQSQSLNSAHIKWTAVQQKSSSTYELVEVSTGGKLSRHNLHVQQLGPDTSTELSTFHLCVSSQTQDLHSRLVLDHPRAYSRQLHKCIVAHSLGQAVFDGNVKVNRYAQQTDAGQLTRSLLLEPRATVNVKPNLQIIADDVKCSHGAAISDLEESQLFYFQARGIDLETARKALVFSFGAEVIDRCPFSFIRKQVERQVKELLSSASQESS
ncbi:protein ABCI7, chloroplastic [Ricinus communis]|uniref:Protein sufD, putative n=1 Tax=Ricinus communis TaxID=3988 RepID=B9T968_RICCO|nr:protein ABCI7, chloroplastic [Ricinus communis]EEF27596.1 Protein sufD, putative [Ricinus communis]|eukprot:XP_002534787.1 protein ABCI7, chloroplastic [Ricinus communis]